MAITKTTFVRICFWLLSQSRGDAIKEAGKIMLLYLDEVKASERTKERLLLLVDELIEGKVSPREFVRQLLREYPLPTRRERVLSLKEFKRVTAGRE